MILMKEYVIDKKKVLHNVEIIKQKSDGAKIYAVVKADGYGIGCLNMAKLCAEGGIRDFAVNDASEAIAIAGSGLEYSDILKLSPPESANEIAELSAFGVTFTAASARDIETLDEFGRSRGCRTKVQIIFDTGMGRRGFLKEQADEVARLIKSACGIELTGIYTHMYNGYNARSSKRQYALFQTLSARISSQGVDVGIEHVCNSSALFYQSDMRLDAVRVGSALFGRIAGEERFGLERTGECLVKIESIKEVPKGTTVGYGAQYKTKRDSLLATLPIGTHNGFGISNSAGKTDTLGIIRRLKRDLLGRNRLFAYIGGARCPVVGAVGAEATVVDVTDAVCRVGDIAKVDINPLLLSHIDIRII